MVYEPIGTFSRRTIICSTDNILFHTTQTNHQLSFSQIHIVKQIETSVEPYMFIYGNKTPFFYNQRVI